MSTLKSNKVATIKKQAKRIAEGKKTLGPQSKYDQSKDDVVAFSMMLLGATEDEVADALQISPRCLAEWKQKYPTFNASMMAGKDKADAQVAQAMFHRALGYEHPHEEIKVVTRPGKNAGSKIVRVKMTKKYAPDTAAGMFWLTNRQRLLWAHKQLDLPETPVAINWIEEKTYEK